MYTREVEKRGGEHTKQCSFSRITTKQPNAKRGKKQISSLLLLQRRWPFAVPFSIWKEEKLHNLDEAAAVAAAAYFRRKQVLLLLTTDAYQQQQQLKKKLWKGTK